MNNVSKIIFSLLPLGAAVFLHQSYQKHEAPDELREMISAGCVNNANPNIPKICPTTFYPASVLQESIERLAVLPTRGVNVAVLWALLSENVRNDKNVFLMQIDRFVFEAAADDVSKVRIALSDAVSQGKAIDVHVVRVEGNIAYFERYSVYDGVPEQFR